MLQICVKYDYKVSKVTRFILIVQYVFLHSQQEDSLFASMPPLCPIGSHPKVQSPKPITGGLGAFTKVSIFSGIILQVSMVLHSLFCGMLELVDTTSQHVTF